MKNLSLYTKLLLWFLLLSLVPLLVIGGLGYVQTRSIIREQSELRLEILAIDTAYKLERYLNQRRTEITSWAQLPVAEAALRGQLGRRAEMRRVLDRFITAYPMYDLLLLVSDDHRIVTANHVDRAGRRIPVENFLDGRLTDGPWFANVRDLGSYVSGFRRSTLLPQIYARPADSLMLSAPVGKNAAEPLGYLIAYFNWTYLQDILDITQATQISELAGQLFMLDLDTGRYIAHEDNTKYNQPYPLRVDLPGVVNADPTGLLHLDWPVPKTLAYAQVRSIEKEQTVPWLVCVEASNADLYRESEKLRLAVVVLVVLIGALAVIAVSLIARRIAMPILELARGVQAIAAGNMEVEMPVDSVDEIGQLANTFNQMSDALRERDEILRLTNQQLTEANRLKSQFLANVSHELRTPMNSIIGYTTLVLQRSADNLPEIHQRNLGKVRKNALHLLKLINSILDLSKIEAGSMDIHREPFTLRPLIEGCVHTIEPLAAEKHLSIIRNLPEQDLLVTSDRGKLQQIFINLLGNAIKFTTEGEIEIGLDLPEPHDPTESFRVWVRDTGIGIPPEHLDSIFTEFAQVEGGPARRFGGTGLGLSISKKLANLLGGDILVESQVSVGSTFTVVLPVRLADAPQPKASDASEGEDGKA